MHNYNTISLPKQKHPQPKLIKYKQQPKQTTKQFKPNKQLKLTTNPNKYQR